MMKNIVQKLFIIFMVVTLALPFISIGAAKVQAATVPVISPTDKIFEAEAGEIALPMQPYSDKPDASGSYIKVPITYSIPNAGNSFPGTALPEATYSIKIDNENTYQVWARVYAPSGASDSFFLAFDNPEYYTLFYMPNTSADWQWVKIATVRLTQDVHMKIKYRESGMGFDRFVVTSNASYTPSGIGEDPETIYLNPYTQPTITPPSGHPRLYVRSSDISRIKDNLTKGELINVWTKVNSDSGTAETGIRAAPASDATNYDDNIKKVVRANALLFLLKGEKPAEQAAGQAAGQKAVTVMENFFKTVYFPPGSGSSYQGQMGEVIVTGAIVYDWCYNLMTDAQRLGFRKNMARIAKDMEMGYPSTKLGAVVGHGAESQLMRNILAFGVAAYDENRNIYDIAAGRFFDQYVDARKYMYTSEWQSQGESYGMSRFQWDMFATLLFDRMGAGNVFSNTNQAKMPYQDIYTRRPDGQRLRYGDGFSTYFALGKYWTNDIMAHMLTSSYYKDKVLRGEFRKEYIDGSSNNLIDDIWMVLFDDPNVLETSPKKESLPLSKYFGSPMGIMVARTGWDDVIDLNSHTAIAQMNIGETYFANHQHLDAGSFQLYYKGGLAIDSGVYQGIAKTDGYFSDHDLNYNKRTIASNSMLVYDSAETFKYYSKTLANDGGQRIPKNFDEPNTLADLKNSANGYTTATVLHHTYGPDANTPDFTYIKGDLTKAYSSNQTLGEKLVDYYRSMVFLNMKDNVHPAVMLVYDKLTTAVPTLLRPLKKTWLLHSQNEPVINGNTVTIGRNEDGYKGKLVNTSLMPSSKSITKVGGPGNEYSVGGVNYPNPTNDSANNPEHGAWRVEISPTTSPAAATDEFLNVMQVMDNGDVQTPGPDPLDVVQVTGDKLVGAKIANRVVLFGKKSQSVSDSATFTVNGSGNLYYLVTDLTPGAWTVTKDGETATTKHTIPEGRDELYFQGNAGTYKLTRYAESTLPEAPAVPNIPAPTP